MFCWYPLSLDNPLFVRRKSEFVSCRDGENVSDVGRPAVGPGPDPPVFRREDQIGFRAVDQVSYDGTVARAGDRGFGRAGEIELIKIAGEGIIESKRSIELKSGAGDELQLTPSPRCFHANGAGNAGDRIRTGQDVLVGSSAQPSQCPATIGFSGKRKPSENGDLPIAGYRPGVDLSGTRIELM
jgi:hypothetical protein